ncbi:MAG: GMC family oxidoreductase N-terminal domain-containing protein [Pseudomonadota bacterium]
MDVFDIIIIGAGSAGCVLADRLSVDGRMSVLVLEAGGTDRRPFLKLPIGYGKTFHDPKVNWRFRTEAEPQLDGRSIYWPRGKGLGGSSSINGLVWSRGLPGDYDDWAAAGNPGWDWASVAPVFDRVEKRIGLNGRVDGEGPIAVADRSNAYNPIKRFFLAAAEEIGLPPVNQHAPVWSEGVGPYHLTTHKGLRCSAADAFLRPAMKRSNVCVQTSAQVTRLTFDGKRATGVEVRLSGQLHSFRARREVILSAGAVHSPQILQVSGVGPGNLLQDKGIAVLHANDAVGGGLQDHMGVDFLYKATEPTLNQELGTWWGLTKSALKFALRRAGPLSLSVNQMGGMVRTSPELPRADMQIYFNPVSYTFTHRNKRPLLQPDKWPGFNVGYNSCRPVSRGRIDITSPTIEDAPLIQPRYLSGQQDIDEAVAGTRLIERLMSATAMRPLIDGPNGFTPEGASDAEVVDHVRATASTVFHACGTCRMAPNGVVGPDLKVHGVEGLRVIDASVFPNITSANTNAPTVMLAQKAAEIFLS